MPAPLITDAYRAQQQALHENEAYGVASVHFAPLVAKIVAGNKVGELLDYGAGKGRLGEALDKLKARPRKLRHYDPAVPKWAATPAPAEMVACIDVLEHIEPELIDNVLDDLARLTGRLGFFTIHTGPAAKELPDGRNAHLIQEPPAWWLPKLLARFELERFERTKGGFMVLVTPKAPAAGSPVSAVSA